MRENTKKTDKLKTILVVFGGILIIGFLLLGGMRYLNHLGEEKVKAYQGNEHEQMVKVVKSPEAQQAIKNGTYEILDEKNTENHKIIKRFTVSNIKKSPIEGISLRVIINCDKKLYISGALIKNKNNNYKFYGSNVSPKLSKMMEN